MLPNMADVGQRAQTAQAENAVWSHAWQTEGVEQVADKTAVEQASAAGAANEAQARYGSKGTDRYPAKDSLDLSFRVTRDERDAMVKAFSKGGELTEEERLTLQSASERISKAIEETLAKRSEKSERVEKAVSEWYSKIAHGEEREPLELIKLLRMASLGQLDLRSS